MLAKLKRPRPIREPYLRRSSKCPVRCTKKADTSAAAIIGALSKGVLRAI